MVLIYITYNFQNEILSTIDTVLVILLLFQEHGEIPTLMKCIINVYDALGGVIT